MTDILDDIDDTLTYYSAGLGSEVTVPVERPDMDPLTWVVDADDVRDMERELCRAMAEACDTGDGHPAISALELATTSQGDTVSTSTVVWHIETSDYAKWTQQEREAVEQFLRDHDIAPRDVLVGAGGTPIDARLTDTGAYQIELWVVDHDENGMRCPFCPYCVRQKFITREVTTAFPLISTAWTAETVHFADESGSNHVPIAEAP